MVKEIGLQRLEEAYGYDHITFNAPDPIRTPKLKDVIIKKKRSRSRSREDDSQDDETETELTATEMIDSDSETDSFSQHQPNDQPFITTNTPGLLNGGQANGTNQAPPPADQTQALPFPNPNSPVNMTQS